MDPYRVETERLAAKVVFVDGQEEAVTLYVPPREETAHSLVHRILGRINTEVSFLPARRQDFDIDLLFNKAHVCWIELDSAVKLTDDDLLGVERKVTLSYPGSLKLEGFVVIDTPESRQRPLDFLNNSDPFFALTQDDRVYLANRLTLSRLYDRPD